MSVLIVRWLPSSNWTTTLSGLDVGTPMGVRLASLPIGVRRPRSIVTAAPSGSGRSRCSGRRPRTTAAPHTVQVTDTAVEHSRSAPTATPTCQKLSLPLGPVRATPLELLTTCISSTADIGLYPTSSAWPSDHTTREKMRPLSPSALITFETSADAKMKSLNVYCAGGWPPALQDAVVITRATSVDAATSVSETLIGAATCKSPLRCTTVCPACRPSITSCRALETPATLESTVSKSTSVVASRPSAIARTRVRWNG